MATDMKTRQALAEAGMACDDAGYGKGGKAIQKTPNTPSTKAVKPMYTKGKAAPRKMARDDASQEFRIRQGIKRMELSEACDLTDIDNSDELYADAADVYKQWLESHNFPTDDIPVAALESVVKALKRQMKINGAMDSHLNQVTPGQKSDFEKRFPNASRITHTGGKAYKRGI